MMTEKRRAAAELALGFAGSMAGFFVLNMFNRYVLMTIPLAGRLVCMPAVYWLSALVPLLLTVLSRVKPVELGFSGEKIPTQIAAGAVLALGLSAVCTLLPYLTGFGEWADNGCRYGHIWQFVYEFVYSILAVSAAEEFVFRGYLYAKARELFGGDRGAVILSSVLFGMAHIFTGNLLQSLMTALQGTVFCVIRLKIRRCSTLSLIIAHGIYDTLISVCSSLLNGT